MTNKTVSKTTENKPAIINGYEIYIAFIDRSFDTQIIRRKEYKDVQSIINELKETAQKIQFAYPGKAQPNKIIKDKVTRGPILSNKKIKQFAKEKNIPDATFSEYYDCNLKPIFEGDIIAGKTDCEHPMGEPFSYERGIVFLHPNSHNRSHKESWKWKGHLLANVSSNCVRIGSIFTNPEKMLYR